MLPFQGAEASEISSQSVIMLTNQARLSNGISTLLENENLMRAARDKVKDMLTNDYFAHTSPQGVAPWHWIKKNGYNYQYAGENLAINFTDAKEQHAAWMKSATHRKNILNPEYADIGVAVAQGKIDGQNSVIVVQMFGARKKSAQGEIAGKVLSNNDNLVSGGEKTPANFNNFPQALSSKKLEFKPGYGGASLAKKQTKYSARDFFEKASKNFASFLVFLLVIANLAIVFRYHRNGSALAAKNMILIAIFTSLFFCQI